MVKLSQEQIILLRDFANRGTPPQLRVAVKDLLDSYKLLDGYYRRKEPMHTRADAYRLLAELADRDDDRDYE